MTRLRALIERPVDPEVARWVVTLALLVTVGLACLVALSATEGSSTRPRQEVDRASPIVDRPVALSPKFDRRPHHRRQDPQDRPGTAAHRLAERQLATHRALQHVPWRDGGVVISLVGARGGKAVLEVRSPSPAAGRRGYRAFLRRFHDDGRAYTRRLVVAGVPAHRGGARR